MKRLLAFLLVALLGLTINPLDWEQKFNEQQDQITALETENEQLRSELDNMKNHMISDTELERLQAYQQSMRSTNFTTSSSAFSDTGLELTLLADKTYHIKLILYIDSNNEDGFELQVISTQNTTMRCVIIGSVIDIAYFSPIENGFMTISTSPMPFICDIESTAFSMIFEGVLHTGANAPTIKVQLASTTDTKDTILYSNGSVLMATKLD